MPVTLTPLRKALLKKELLNPKNTVKSALLKSGYALSTADNSTSVKAVKICQAEIAAEINKPELIRKAYHTLDRNLTAPERPVQIAASATILKFTEGEISRIKEISDDDKTELANLRNFVQVNISKSK